MKKLCILLLLFSSCSDKLNIDNVNKCNNLATLIHATASISIYDSVRYCALDINTNDYEMIYNIPLNQVDAAMVMTSLYSDKEKYPLRKKCLKECLDKIPPKECYKNQIKVEVKECRKSCGFGY